MVHNLSALLLYALNQTNAIMVWQRILFPYFCPVWIGYIKLDRKDMILLQSKKRVKVRQWEKNEYGKTTAKSSKNNQKICNCIDIQWGIWFDFLINVGYN